MLCDWQGRTLRFLIIDDKTHLSGPVFKQLWAYRKILSEPNCLYTKSIDEEGEEIERRVALRRHRRCLRFGRSLDDDQPLQISRPDSGQTNPSQAFLSGQSLRE